MISLSAVVYAIFYLIVGGVIFGLLYWLVDACKTPEPFNRIAKAILLILAVFICIGVLLSFVTGANLFRP